MLSQYNVALMHTVNHAFFKALLFLGAGAVIHSFQDQQDVRKMGGLIKFLPFTYSVMLVGSLSLLATPFLTGFYSKDLILELAYSQYKFNGLFAYILGSITAGLTAFYSFRLINLVFFSYPNGPKESYLNSHESNLLVVIPLFLLAIFSIFFGYIFSDLFVGIGSDFFANSIFIHPNNISLVEAEFSLNPIIKLLPAILSFVGAILAIFIYSYPPLLTQIISIGSIGGSNIFNTTYKKLYAFLNGKYFFDVAYNQFIVVAGFKLAYIISKEIDRGIIEAFGPFGVSNIMQSAANNLSKLDTGIITTYALYITLSLISLLLLVFAPILNEFLFFATTTSEGNLTGNLVYNEVFDLRIFIIYLLSALIISNKLNSAPQETFNKKQ